MNKNVNKIILSLLLLFSITFAECIEINSTDINTEHFIELNECIYINDLNITINTKNFEYAEYNFSGGEGNELFIPERNLTIIGENIQYNHTNISYTENGEYFYDTFNVTLFINVEQTIENVNGCNFTSFEKILSYGETYTNIERNITCVAPELPKINLNKNLNYGEKYTNTQYNLNVTCKEKNETEVNYILNYGETKTFTDGEITCVAPKKIVCPVCQECPELIQIDATLKAGETKTYEKNKIRVTCLYEEKEIFKSRFDLLGHSPLEDCMNTITLYGGAGEKVCVDNLNDFCITDMVKQGNLIGCVENLNAEIINEKESCLTQLTSVMEQNELLKQEVEVGELRLNDRNASDREIIIWLIVAVALCFVLYAIYLIYQKMRIPKDDIFNSETKTVESPKNLSKLGRRDELE